MSPQTFVFVGRSGCGKGTQAELLRKHLVEKDPATEIFYLETGANFREFIQGKEYSNKQAREVYENGERQPDFLAIWMWANELTKSFKGTEHLFFDGITRSLPEAMTFTTAMDFYGRKATIIYIDVSRGWSERHLLARGRADDKNLEEVKKRLDWFEKDSVQAIDYFNVHEAYDLLTINGEQTVEEVHGEILTKLGW